MFGTSILKRGCTILHVRIFHADFALSISVNILILDILYLTIRVEFHDVFFSLFLTSS